MAVRQRNDMTGTGQSLVLVGVLFLAVNVIQTYQAAGFTARFARTFFVTQTVEGVSLWLVAFVWGPVILIPLGIVLWVLGNRRRKAERERLAASGDPMGSGFVGQVPGEHHYDPQFGAAAQASYGPTIAGSVAQPDSEVGPQYGEQYNRGD